MPTNETSCPIPDKEKGTSASQKSLLINLISGGVGGFCVVLVGYPFDLLKTRVQTNPSSHLFTEIKSIWRSAGYKGFYQGASAPLIGVTPIFAANFYGYELGKRLYGRLTSSHKTNADYSFNGGLPLGQYAFAAAFSALQTSLVVIPAERIKVCMQMPRPINSQLAQKNAIQVGMKLFREGGLRALFRGTAPTLTRDVPGLMTFFTTYELFKQWLGNDYETEKSLRYMSSVMAAGGLSGMASWMVSLPSDVLKSRVQAAARDDILSRVRFPTLHVLRDLLWNEGPFALYRGIVPVLLRAFPANAACFLGYEITKLSLQVTLV